MTKYSKIRHQDLHTQNIMIKSIDTISDIKVNTMADKIKSILNNSNFKINIKLIDFGRVRELYREETTEYFTNLIKMQRFLFEKYTVFEDDFIYSGFLHLTEVLEILRNKDNLEKTNITLDKLNYFRIYKGSIEELLNEEYFKRFQLLLQDAAPLRVDVVQGAVGQGKNAQTSHYMFVLRDLDGEDKCQTGKFRKCRGENPTMTLDGSGDNINVVKGTEAQFRSTVVGGGKKSKKNNKRKRKFRSKKNKK